MKLLCNPRCFLPNMLKGENKGLGRYDHDLNKMSNVKLLFELKVKLIFVQKMRKIASLLKLHDFLEFGLNPRIQPRRIQKFLCLPSSSPKASTHKLFDFGRRCYDLKGLRFQFFTKPWPPLVAVLGCTALKIKNRVSTHFLSPLWLLALSLDLTWFFSNFTSF